MKERDLVAPVTRFLESRGYRVWADPDRTDYLDVVALGEDVGLVELKLARPTAVVGQALRRRGLADWVAVALPRRSQAERALRAADGPLASRVGVWVVSTDRVDLIREAGRWPAGETPEPFADTRARFRAMVGLAADGTIPAGAAWGDVRGRRERRASRHYYLDEFRENEPVKP